MACVSLHSTDGNLGTPRTPHLLNRVQLRSVSLLGTASMRANERQITKVTACILKSQSDIPRHDMRGNGHALILGELEAVPESLDLSPDLRPSLLGEISGLQEEGCSTLSRDEPIPSSVKRSVRMNPLPAPGEYSEPFHFIERD